MGHFLIICNQRRFHSFKNALTLNAFSIADLCNVALHGLDSHLDGALSGQVTPDEAGRVDENTARDTGHVGEFLVITTKNIPIDQFQGEVCC